MRENTLHMLQDIESERMEEVLIKVLPHSLISAVPNACPQCNHTRLFKDGLRHKPDGSQTQRWLCQKCNYRFSQRSPPPPPRCVKGSILPTSQEIIKTKKHYKGKCRASNETLQGRAHNSLARRLNLANSTPQQEAQREGTQSVISDNSSKIIAYLWCLQKAGTQSNSIKKYSSCLTHLAKHTDLTQPESIKEYLVKNQKISNTTKRFIVAVYDGFLKYHCITWQRPKYRPVEKIPYIPPETDLDTLIAGGGKILSAFLQFLKDTAARSEEAVNTKWIDVDFERKIVTINHPAKGSKARKIPVSNKLIDMLNRLPRRSSNIFTSVVSMKSTFHDTRKSLIFKLQNPSLKAIHLHTFRHWKATMEYYKHKDIIRVQTLLGHCDIKCTMRYITIADSLFQSTSDDYVTKVATTINEACALIDVGFEYVTEMEGAKLFRKRK